MSKEQWQIQHPISRVVFDCDGTLSTIEGIDELAENNGVGETVKALTAEAMGASGINPAIYKKRLDLVLPTKEQVNLLGQQYIKHCVEDAVAVINILKRLSKTIYIVSAGLYQAVALFGEFLQVPLENIYAVKAEFDSKGNYLDYDHSSPLTSTDGKREIIVELKKTPGDIFYIGDGLNDLSVRDLVSRFVGYGGVYYRENIAAECQFYIRSLSISPVLPLSLTLSEVDSLSLEEKISYEKGLSLLK